MGKRILLPRECITVVDLQIPVPCGLVQVVQLMWFRWALSSSCGSGVGLSAHVVQGPRAVSAAHVVQV
jgi:hypothetical protein